MNIKFLISLLGLSLPLSIIAQNDSLSEHRLQTLHVKAERIDIERLAPVQNTFIWSGKKNEVIYILNADVNIAEKEEEGGAVVDQPSSMVAMHGTIDAQEMRITDLTIDLEEKTALVLQLQLALQSKEEELGEKEVEISEVLEGVRLMQRECDDLRERNESLSVRVLTSSVSMVNAMDAGEYHGEGEREGEEAEGEGEIVREEGEGVGEKEGEGLGEGIIEREERGGRKDADVQVLSNEDEGDWARECEIDISDSEDNDHNNNDNDDHLNNEYDMDIDRNHSGNSSGYNGDSNSESRFNFLL